MALTAAQRKAIEVKRKTENGLKRRSFWLDDEALQALEKYKIEANFKSNDEALAHIIKQYTK